MLHATSSPNSEWDRNTYDYDSGNFLVYVKVLEKTLSESNKKRMFMQIKNPVIYGWIHNKNLSASLERLNPIPRLLVVEVLTQEPRLRGFYVKVVPHCQPLEELQARQTIDGKRGEINPIVPSSLLLLYEA
jgi:hypothetical protein